MATGGVYEQGTVTIAGDRVSVTGVGTFWDPIAEQGDWLFVAGQVGLIETVVDNTHMSLYSQWVGTLPSAATYVLVKMSWLRYDPALTQAKVRELLEELDAQGNFLFVEGSEPDPSMGNIGQWALKTNVSPWQLWFKEGPEPGTWVAQATPAGMRWRGAYSNALLYAPGDGVQYQGASYIAKLASGPPSHQVPTNVTYWDLMAQGGAQGAPGVAGPPGMVWKGTWVSTTNYVVNDAVQLSGASYICVVPNLNSQPPSSNWNVLAAAGSATIGPSAIEASMLNSDNSAEQLVFRTRLNFVSREGDTLSGALILPNLDPAANNEATRKLYVDTQDGVLNTAIGGKVAKIGDSMSGKLSIVSAVGPALDAKFSGAGAIALFQDNLADANAFIEVRGQFSAYFGSVGGYPGVFKDAGVNGAFWYDTNNSILGVAGGAMLQPANAYLNFNSTSGVGGYGFRDNMGTMEVKKGGTTTWSPLAQAGLDATQQGIVRQNISAASAEVIGCNNLLVNGSIDVSQQVGGSGVFFGNGSVVAYSMDQWYFNKTGSSNFSVYQSPGQLAGLANSLFFAVSVAQPSMVSDVVILAQPIEGTRFARAMWGTAQGLPVTVVFRGKFPETGNIMVRISSPDFSAFSNANITVNNANVEQTFITTFTPPAVSSAWPKTTAMGARFEIFLAQAGQVNCVRNVTNTVLGGFIMLVGNYVPDTLPLIQAAQRPFSEELAACCRYWRWCPPFSGGFQQNTTTISVAGGYEPMRVAPGTPIIVNATGGIHDFGSGFLNINSIVNHGLTDRGGYITISTASATSALGRLGGIADATKIALTARM